MKYFTDTDFATLESAVADVRTGKYPAAINGVKPVIVKTQISPRKTTVGVQYWNDVLISAGQAINTDGTLAVMIELL